MFVRGCGRLLVSSSLILLDKKASVARAGRRHKQPGPAAALTGHQPGHRRLPKVSYMMSSRVFSIRDNLSRNSLYVVSAIHYQFISYAHISYIIICCFIAECRII